MILNNIKTSLIYFLFIYLSGFNLFAQENKIKNLIKLIGAKYAPDKRVAVYNITYESINNNISLTGEVDNTRAKDELINEIRIISNKNIIDNISVLPDSSLKNHTKGITIKDVSDLRATFENNSELSTQALMGTVLKLLKQKSGFYYAQMPDGYLGWIDTSNVYITDQFGIEKWQNSSKVIVNSFYGIVWKFPDRYSDTICSVVLGCILKRTEKINDEWIQVELPNGKQGFLLNSIADDFQTWISTRIFTPDNIQKTAQSFLGIPYLWGGNSVKGFDCSGFVKTVYMLNGQQLPRDADQQSNIGKRINAEKNFKLLRKGDLLFFANASKKTKRKVGHVAIYLGDLLFIHSDKYVQYCSFDTKSQYYNPRLVKRFLYANRLF